MSEPKIVKTDDKQGVYYPMVLQGVGADGQLYGLRVTEGGEVEYFGDYDPDEKSRELHKALGPAMVKVFPRQPVLQVRKLTAVTHRPEEEVFCVEHGLQPTGTSNPSVRPGVWRCTTPGCENETVRRGEYERRRGDTQDSEG